jgi:hypothetical protein
MPPRNRFKTVLLDPTWEETVGREPLIAFSHYLSGRVNVLMHIADEVIENLDDGFGTDFIHGGKVTRAETLMWLWILGAYEVVRTMCQAKRCFSQTALVQLHQLKKQLSVVRMPAAKMEEAGVKIPVSSDRSAVGWVAARKDLMVNSPDAADVSARALLDDFDRVFSAIRPEDILARHEQAYQ